MSSTPATPAATAPAAPAAVWCMLAEFKDADALVQAATKVREAGYTRFDCHASYPIHGLSDAMKLKPSLVPLTALVAAVGAGVGALGLQWFTSAVDYKIAIGGKAYFSVPAFMPITSMAVILTAALVALIAAVVFGKPLLHHPLFNSPRFAKASDDAFFVGIEAADPKFDLAATRRFLESLGGTHVEVVHDV